MGEGGHGATVAAYAALRATLGLLKEGQHALLARGTVVGTRQA